MEVFLITGALLVLLDLIIVYSTMKISSKISRMEEAELEELKLIKGEKERENNVKLHR